MNLSARIKAFDQLGKQLKEWIELEKNGTNNPLSIPIQRSFQHNGWFDPPQVVNSFDAIIPWLNEDTLTKWVASYDFPEQHSPKKVGIIMAGNIPMVGFHDYLSVLISGNKLIGKLSSKDQILIPFLHEELVKIEPRFAELADFQQERLNDLDAVIATGSDNSSRYFDYYFSKIPHIIRKNRTSVAVLNGSETKEQLHALGDDMFRYFGLGCRNVTKVYFPKDFDIDWFYTGIVDHGNIINVHKYQNNYDYHKSLFMLNGDKLWDNNFLILKPDTGLHSPVGTLFYEEYSDLNELKAQLDEISDQIQCQVGEFGLPLGAAQSPSLEDYPDNINVLDFLAELK